MFAPQKGIIEENRKFGLFLNLRFRQSNSSAIDVAQRCAKFPDFVEEVSRKDPQAGLLGSVSFGSDFWDLIQPRKRPKFLRPFESIFSDTHVVPATHGDILFHISSDRRDLNDELAEKVLASLSDTVETMERVNGFTYLDSRDLTGFIDGTANPKGDDERKRFALIGTEDLEFAGGSYVLTQRYIHDLQKWQKLPITEQEKIIGRTKDKSEELPPPGKPSTAHISRASIPDKQEENKIVRHSYPYTTATGDTGLFFIAYARDLNVPQKLLERMFGASGDGIQDHLMDYSRPVTGAYFFTPSLNILSTLGISSVTEISSERAEPLESKKQSGSEFQFNPPAVEILMRYK